MTDKFSSIIAENRNPSDMFTFDSDRLGELDIRYSIIGKHEQGTGPEAYWGPTPDSEPDIEIDKMIGADGKEVKDDDLSEKEIDEINKAAWNHFLKKSKEDV